MSTYCMTVNQKLFVRVRMTEALSSVTVYPNIIEKHLSEELPFMATENILMYCVKKCGDRQLLHERIRLHSVNAAKKIKQDGGENDLIAHILADTAFGVTEEEINGLLRAEQFTGRAKEQTDEFLSEVRTVHETNKELLGLDVKISV